MFLATTRSVPARTAIGTAAASGAANSRITSSVTAWHMPATGVRPPERTLVAVRAIAPVAGSPPKSGEAMLAIPCAKSSTLELCRPPVSRSATTADISDSIAPSIATVSVGDSSVRIRSGRKRGMWNAGRPDGMPPNRVPIVSTPRWAALTITVPATRATTYPGTRGTYRFHTTMSRTTPIPTAAVRGDAAPTFRASTSTRPMKSPGTGCASVMPRKSLICVLAMTSAMPLVNPITTGRGMNLTAVPVPVMPRTTSSTPAIIVHMKRPSTP
jgi:hypothetical protein